MKYIGVIMAWGFNEPPTLVYSTRRHTKARHKRKAWRVCRRNMAYIDRNHRRPWAVMVTMK